MPRHPPINKLWLPIILAATAGAFWAQSAGASETIYRLNDSASFQEGCFDPCTCPIGPEYSVRGTFKLGPSTPGNVVDFHELSAINWRVVFGNTVIHSITGTGTYRISNFGPDRFHSLDLDLSIDGEESQHFFSDDTSASSTDGSIDLVVSINGIFCYDIVIRINASPVPDDELTSYVLTAGSNYQIACFDPCDCVSQQPRAMRGHFDLVPLLDFGTYAEFTIVNARFGVGAMSIVDAMLVLTGTGHYTLIQGIAGPAHATELNLATNGDPLTRFDQDLENTNTVFPAIDIVVDMNDMVCTDTILTLKARPLSRLSPATGTRDQSLYRQRAVSFLAE